MKQKRSTMTNYQCIDFVLKCGLPYFPRPRLEDLAALPLRKSETGFHTGYRKVILPKWAEDIGVGKPASLLVPTYCLATDTDGEDWQGCDWWQACFHFLSGEAERAVEDEKGPIHSYSSLLPDEMEQVFEHAWVNRIMLFLRRWCAVKANRDEEEMFGPKPKARILLTHDVDALEKTLPIRAKQLAFSLFNSLRLLKQAQLKNATLRLYNGVSFFFRPADYAFLDHITKLEEKYGQTSIFNIYGGNSGWTRPAKQILLDPGYDIAEKRYSSAFKKLIKKGFAVGLHQSYDAWRDSDQMLAQRDRVADSLGCRITNCRQHWLRFSWEETWAAQEEAGFTLDTTLGFNDRPGFRSGAALKMPAWLATEGKAAKRLEIIPLVLMDSHLFDYDMGNKTARRNEIDRWLDEIISVGGTASFVWHQRVFHPKDYGWGDEYEYLLSRLADIQRDISA